jgi:CRP-like cAMP-binding protein
VLGLTAVLASAPYEVTAETCRPCQVAFVEREDFLQFVADHPQAYPGIVKQLRANYDGACKQLRNLGLSSSVSERVGRLLLEWSAGSKETKLGIQISLDMTQAEMGELLGISRETVTRTFRQFRDQRLVLLKGSTVTIPNRAALESFVTN